MKILRFIIPILALQNCTAQPAPKFTANADENTLLWEISGKGLKKPSYLFGTFHMMCKDDIQISQNLNNTIIAADEVYFEMDLDDMSNTLGALFFMNMKEGKKLKDLYSEDEYNRIKNFFNDSIGTPIALLEKMKPLFLQALLYPKMMDCKKKSGMEEELMKIAKEHKKEIKGFETIAFQASMFDSIPYEMQAKELLNSVDSLSTYQDDFDSMVAIYKSQKLNELESFLDSDLTVGASKELLLDKRNMNWVGQLKELLPGKSLFIAVGAGHLVGNKGLIKLLRDEGYTVSPLLNK